MCERADKYWQRGDKTVKEKIDIVRQEIKLLKRRYWQHEDKIVKEKIKL